MNQEDTKRYDLWKIGCTDSEIANICNVSKSAISSWRKKNGLKSNSERQGKYLEKEEEEKRFNLFKEGYTDSEIGTIVGVTSFSIYQWRQRRGLVKSKPISEKIDSLSPKEGIFFDYLKNKYPYMKESVLLSLAKYVEPKTSVSPTSKQRDFIKKIKIPGFTTVYYFDDNEYRGIDEAMKLFISTNYENLKENYGKIQANMTKEYYDKFREIINS